MKGYPIDRFNFSSRPDVTTEKLRDNIKEAIAKIDYADAEARVIASMATGIFGGLTVMVNKYLPDDVIIVGEKTYQAMLKLAPYEVGDKK